MHQPPSPSESSSQVDGSLRKRVCKACDRCRLKKSKCDGSSPCGRCRADNAICVFGERKKSHDKVYPKGYVEMLEQQQSQLVTGIQELYKLAHDGNVWVGSPLKEGANGHPLTHDILERLGALKQDGHVSEEQFEENIELMQQRLIANGAGLMQRHATPDSGSEHTHSPILENVPFKPTLSAEPFAIGSVPLTPPNDISMQTSTASSQPMEYSNTMQQMPTSSSIPPSLLQWPAPVPSLEDNMDFIQKFESPVTFDNFSPQLMQSQFAMASMTPNDVSMRDWSNGCGMKSFFDPTLA